jgi:putative transposase
MPSSHVQIYCHIVFSTKERRPFIHESWRRQLHAYMTGILQNLGLIVLQVGGTADHTHSLIDLRASHGISEILCKMKASSCGWIHQVIGYRPFAWQKGYGAFSVSKSDVPAVREYIRNQPEHHRVRSFQEEFLEMLKTNGIEFDEKYLW